MVVLHALLVNSAESSPLHAFHGLDDLPTLTTQTFIGIMVAITGNVLISLALNLQKLAHKRVEKLKNESSNGQPQSGTTSFDERDEDHETTRQEAQTGVFSDGSTPKRPELQPLITHTVPVAQVYGTETLGSPSNSQGVKAKRTFMSRLIPMRTRGKKSDFLLPVDIISEDAALHGLSTLRRKPKVKGDGPDAVEDSEGEYLKSKLWWLGFLLMNVGEMGNFISYAFAPASVVAPLGTFALMANCFFAPLLLGEHFRKRDLLGVAIAIIGAVTVVLASNASDTRLDPDALLRAISQTSFIVYSCIYAAGAISLAALSEGSIGKQYVFVDVGICSLFGGFTVLSTKALSTLLTLQWIEIFTQWITYPLILVLVSTGVGQIRYLNRALMRFDSKVVIPVQFVLFTLSAITGSAILYGDFQKARFHEIVTFLYGCAATFAGVFIIAWSPKNSEDDDEQDTVVEARSASDHAQMSPDSARLGMGTIGRRQRAALILPSGVSGPNDTPVLKRRRSGIALMGISPAQHLLLVHTPPRDIPQREWPEGDSDAQSPTSYGRRRTISWFGHEGHRDPSGTVTRDGSKLRNGPGRVGSLDGQSHVQR